MSVNFSKPFAQGPHAAVVIKSTRVGRFHVGLAYRDGGKGRTLHLEWHKRLADAPLDTSFGWVEPSADFNRSRARSLAGLCRLVATENESNSIPYGFAWPVEAFDEKTGKYKEDPSRAGLTCATFVLAIFDWASMPLVDIGTWPNERPGDKEWQESIVEDLKKTNPPVDQVHIEAVMKEIGAKRCRPPEVAAAFTRCPRQSTFTQVEDLSQDIANQVAARAPKPQVAQLLPLMAAAPIATVTASAILLLPPSQPAQSPPAGS